MKRLVSRSLALLAILGLSGVAIAESYSEVFTCTTEDEKTLDDVQAANSKWLAFVHKNVSEDITSSVVSAVVGDTSVFLFVDTYPDLATWANTKTRLDQDDVEEMDLFEGVSECTTNSLYKSELTE